MNPIGLGIIGCGGIAAVHSKAARRSGFTVVGCWDANTARAAEFAAATGTVAAPSREALLSMPGIEAVAVAVSTDAHAACAEATLAADRHVLLEKPMALTVAQCDSICAAAKRSKGRLQMGLVCRSSLTAMHALGIVRSGAVGTIDRIQVRGQRRRGIPGLGGWFTTKARSGGGCMIDVGVHLVDLALHIARWPRVERVSATMVSRFGSPIAGYRFEEMWGGPPRLDGTFDVEDSALVLLRCAGGVTVEVDVAWAINVPEGVARDGVLVLGSGAGVHFEIFGTEVRTTRQSGEKMCDEVTPVPSENPWDAAWDSQYRRFGAMVRGQAEPAATAAEGHDLQRILAATYESAALGREVEVR